MSDGVSRRALPYALAEAGTGGMLRAQRNVRQIAYDVERSSRQVRAELVIHLAKMEADGRGNTD
jgi:hypothetical protein